MNFNPMGFVENLKYMEIGMLGVFIIVGIIILSTYAIGKIAANLPQNDEEERNK